MGLEGQTLIEEVKNNPVQAAELIFLASEIRKGAGDEGVLTDGELAEVEEFVKNEIDAAAERAAEAPFPEDRSLLPETYAGTYLEGSGQ